MDTQTAHRKILRASLCEIERGVFYASYSPGNRVPGTDSLSNYRVGQTPADAKQWFERNALALGYDAVDWTETSVAPPFPIPPDSNRRKPGSAFAARRLR